MKKAYILTECGNKIGYGHLIRCMPLYDELYLRQYDVTFMLYGDVNEAIIKGYKYEQIDWYNINYIVLKDSVCIVDSYLADKKNYSDIAAVCNKLIVIDDYNRLNYENAVVVNPSLFGDTVSYLKNDSCTYLLGSCYIILRKELRKHFSKTISNKINTCTVIMGGTDVLNLSRRITEALSRNFPDLRIDVITRNPFPVQGDKIDFLSDLSASEMACQFLLSDIVISAGGQTCNELVQLKTPSVIAEVAHNQRGNVNAMVKGGFSLEMSVPNAEEDVVRLLRQMTYNIRYEMYLKMCGLDFSDGVSRIIRDSKV